jgi:transposase-like protein
MTNEELDSVMAKAKEQFRKGEPLFGKNGAFHFMLENFLNTALETEMDEHLAENKGNGGKDRRNGKMRKTVQSEYGPVEIETPRDRDGSFEPEVVKKRETILAEGLSDKIISLYATGQSTRDISKFIEDNYGSSISAETISHITDRVWPEIQSWRSRSLEDVYPIVWLDAIHYKVKDEKGAVVSRAIYNVLGVDRYGFKDLLGMYVSQNEGANFWLGVLTDLKNRGVKDILIACIDGLKGFPDAINAVFPQTDVQLCIVHQIRNSLKYIASKNQKEFLADLKLVYQAATQEKAETELSNLDTKWGEKYPIVIRSWQENWQNLSRYFQYTAEIRKLIYTTNTVEGYHRQIRKVTKTKGVFSSDESLLKLVYLAYRNIKKKWTMPLANWSLIAQQLCIRFEERFKIL